MKDVLTYTEIMVSRNAASINEGLLSNIKNLFTSDYTIKNPILKELLREVDCPISWKETKLRNSILKLVDEFVATQAKTYTEELIAAKDKDDKEGAGEITFDSESHFGTLKSKRLVEKASATLSALKDLASSSKTGGDAVTKWVQIVYDEAVIATIQTALNNTEIDGTLKEKETTSLEKAQKQLQEEVKKSHKENADAFKEAVQKYAKDQTIADYTPFIDKGESTFKVFTEIVTTGKIAEKLGKGDKALGIDNGDNASLKAVVGLGLSAGAGEQTTAELIKNIKKEEQGRDKVNVAFTVADNIITELALADKCNWDKVKQLKQFTGPKAFGQVSNLIDRLIAAGCDVLSGQPDKVTNNIAELEKFKQNYEKYQKI